MQTLLEVALGISAALGCVKIGLRTYIWYLDRQIRKQERR